jgi:outer membrane protein assembly factor BamB
MRICLSVVLIFASGVATAQESEWTHWRGPNQNGSVETGTPPIEWGLDKNIIWKVELPGQGSSTPIIVGDQVIILSAVKTDSSLEEATEPKAESPRGGSRGERGAGGRAEGGRGGGGRGGGGRGGVPTSKYKFLVLSYDRNTGEKNWEQSVAEEVPHEGIHSTNTFASSSPTTDGEHLFVDFSSRGIYCLDLNGKIVWKQSLGKMRTRNSFGEGASAALWGDRLFVPWDHEGNSFIAALDKSNGNVIWKTERDEATTWATPLVVEHNGRTQVILNGTSVRSYDAQDGGLIWECGGQTGNAIPTPMVCEDKVICMTGFRGNAVYCIALDSEGDVSSTSKVAWKYSSAGPYVPTGTLYRNQIYLNKANTSVVASLDAKTGKEMIKPQRLSDLGEIYSSPVAVNDHIYFTDRSGTTAVIKHGDSLDVVAKNSLGETIDSSLAIVGDRIFIRGEKHLFCIGKE